MRRKLSRICTAWRNHNPEKGKSETTNNDLQNTRKTTKDCATRIPQNKTGTERMFSEKGSNQFLLPRYVQEINKKIFQFGINDQ
jgi:hypothetical protein